MLPMEKIAIHREVTIYDRKYSKENEMQLQQSQGRNL